MPYKRRVSGGDIAKGFGLGVLLNLIMAAILLWFPFEFLFYFFGATQLIFLAPAAVLMEGNRSMRDGLWIAAGLTLLLNFGYYLNASL